MAGFDVHDRRFNTSTAIVLMKLKKKTPKDFWVLVDIPEASRTLFALPESLLVLPQVTLNALHTIQGLFSLELSGAPVPREISLLFANIGQKLVPPSGEHLWIDQAQLPNGSQVLLPISEVLGSVCSALSDESMWSAEKIKENHQKFKKALLEQIDFDRCGTLFRNELVAILTSIDYPGVQVFRNFREFLAVKTDQFILTELTKRWDSDPFSTAKMFFNYFHAKNTVQELDFFELLFSNRPPQEKMKLCLELRKFIQQELIALGYLDEHLKATHPEIAVDIATLTSYIGDVHLRDSNQIFLSALTLKEDGPFVKEIVIQKATEAYYSRNLEDKIPAYLASRPLVLPENHPFTRLYALVTDYPEMKITSVFQGFYEGLWLATKESSKDDKITLLLANMPAWQRIYLTQEDPSIPETFSGSKADLIDSIETTWKESYPAALQDKLISDIRSLRTLFIQVKTEESWLSSVKEVPTRLKPEAVDMVSSILLEIQTRNLEKGTQLILDLMGKKKALMRLMEKRYGDIARLPEQENISYFLARVSELDGLTSIEEFDRLVDKLNQRGFQALIDNFIQTYSSGMYLSIENFFAKCRTAEARDQKKLWDEYFSYEAKEDNFLEHVLKLRNKDGEILVGPYHIARVFLMAVTTPRATWSDALSSAVPLVREFVQKQDAGLEGSVRQTSYPPHFFAFLDSDPGAWLRTMPEAFQAMMNLYGSEQDQQRACEFFVYFSYKNPDNQSKIAEIPGMLEALKDCLGSSTASVKVVAAVALINLAFNHPDNRSKIAEIPGMLEALKDCLRSTDAEVQTEAAGALINLAFNHPDNRSKIAEIPGMLEALKDCLRSTEVSIKTPAAEALQNLACHPDNRSKIAEIPGMLEALKDCLRSTDAEVQTEAAEALRNLACHPDNQSKIAEIPGMLEALKDCLGSSTASVKVVAAVALQNLACHPDNQIKIAEIPGMLEALKDCLGSSNASVKVVAAGALRNLACHPDNRSKIAEIPGMLEALKNGLAVDNEDLKISLLAFLGNLMLNNDSIMKKILEMDLKSTLIRLFYKASSEKTKSPFSWALSHLIPRMSPDDLTKSASEELKKSLEQFIPYLNEEGKKSVEVNLRRLIELESARAEAAVDVSKKTAAINTGAKLASGKFSDVLQTATLQVDAASRALRKYKEQNPHKDFTNLNTKDPGVLRYRKLKKSVSDTDQILNQEGLTEERKGFMFNEYFDSVVKNIVSGKDYNPFFHRKRQSGLDTLLQKEMSDFMGASVDSLSTSVSPSPRSSMSTPFRFRGVLKSDANCSKNY